MQIPSEPIHRYPYTGRKLNFFCAAFIAAALQLAIGGVTPAQAKSYEISLSSASASVTEGINATNTFTVHVSPAVAEGEWVKVNIRTFPYSLAPARPDGEDFLAPDGIPHTSNDVGIEYTLGPGEDHLDIVVDIVDDSVVEGTQQFYLDAFSPTTSSGSSVGPVLVYRLLPIIDNDGHATVDLVKTADGIEGSVNATFKVSTAAKLETQVNVSLSTVDGTAVTSDDYMAISNQVVSLGSGATASKQLDGSSQEVTVTIQNDQLVETDETFSAQITAGTKSVVGSGSATATITDNDHAPTSSDGSVTTNEDTAYLFSSGDFSFSDEDGETLQKIIVATLPGSGALILSGTVVVIGQEIALPVTLGVCLLSQ